MRQFVSPNRKISEFQVRRGQDPKKSIIFVEGKSDEEFFKKMFSFKFCRFIQCEGKENVKNVLRALNSRSQKGILGIVDADFDTILQRSSFIEYLFYTDTHDIETMIIASGFSLENAVRMYFDSDKYEVFLNNTNQEFDEIIFEATKYLGILRLVSLDENLNLDFKELEYGLFLDDKLKINLEKLCEHLIQKSMTSIDKDTLMEKVENHGNRSYSFLDICCGHDIAGIISYGLKNIIGTEKGANLEESQLEERFRSSYNNQEFVQTELYKDLNSWEDQNKPFALFDTTSEPEKVDAHVG